MHARGWGGRRRRRGGRLASRSASFPQSASPTHRGRTNRWPPRGIKTAPRTPVVPHFAKLCPTAIKVPAPPASAGLRGGFDGRRRRGERVDARPSRARTASRASALRVKTARSSGLVSWSSGADVQIAALRGALMRTDGRTAPPALGLRVAARRGGAGAVRGLAPGGGPRSSRGRGRWRAWGRCALVRPGRRWGGGLHARSIACASRWWPGCRRSGRGACGRASA